MTHSNHQPAHSAIPHLTLPFSIHTTHHDQSSSPPTTSPQTSHTLIVHLQHVGGCRHCSQQGTHGQVLAFKPPRGHHRSGISASHHTSTSTTLPPCPLPP